MHFPKYFLIAVALGGVSFPIFAQTNVWNSSGNIGIGTTTPADKLEIRADNNALWDEGQLIVGGQANLNQKLSIGFDTTNNIGFIQALISGTNYFPLVLQPHGGNVGIGTNAPVAKFQVVAGTGNQSLASYAPTSASGIVDFTDGGVGWVFSRPEDGAFAHGIFTYNSGTLKNNLAISARSDLVLMAGGGGPSNALERMRINESGNVGVGTANPTTKLEINGDLSLRASPHAYMILSGTTGDSEILLQESGANRWAMGMNVGESSQNFNIYNYTTGATNFSINKSTGRVGIGTTSPQTTLAVAGTITAKEVVVTTSGWADYVFAKGYDLRPLSEVEQEIKANGHLPGIPSAAEVAKQGVSLGALQAKLLAKIEELTLHQIAQEKRIANQAAQLADVLRKNDVLQARVDELSAHQ